MSREPCAVGRATYVVDGGRGTASRYPLALLSTAVVVCASARMLPIFGTSLWLVSVDTSWWDFTHQYAAAASPTDHCMLYAGDAFAASVVSQPTPLLLARPTFALPSEPLGPGGALPHTAPAPHLVARTWCYLPTSPVVLLPLTTCR